MAKNVAPVGATRNEVKVAAAKRAAAAEGKIELTDAERRYVDALAVERRGYVRRGLDDRVAEVDAELHRCGGA